MCVNYQPPKRPHIFEMFGAAIHANSTWPDEVWKDYSAPIVRALVGGANEAILATYGIVPRKHIPPGVKVFDTMNARSETVGEKRSYSKAWRNCQTCLIPMECFFEPNYISGKSERWKIDLTDGKPFAVAGLWRDWKESDGSEAHSFTQLTINADSHPFMKQFHKPGDEKRSLVILRPEEYQAWLSCRDPEVARSFLTLYPSELMAGSPAPKPPKK